MTKTTLYKNFSYRAENRTRILPVKPLSLADQFGGKCTFSKTSAYFITLRCQMCTRALFPKLFIETLLPREQSLSILQKIMALIKLVKKMALNFFTDGAKAMVGKMKGVISRFL